MVEEHAVGESSAAVGWLVGIHGGVDQARPHRSSGDTECQGYSLEAVHPVSTRHGCGEDYGADQVAESDDGGNDVCTGTGGQSYVA